MQASFDQNPFMAVSRIQVLRVRFLDGSELGDETVEHFDLSNGVHLAVVAACAGVVFISVLGTGIICVTVRQSRGKVQEPAKTKIPSSNSKTTRTSRSSNPTFVIYHMDQPSVTSSITEQRNVDELLDYASYAMSYDMATSVVSGSFDMER